MKNKVVSNNISISICPSFNALYYSYYLFGLMEEFGNQAISYNATDWPKLHHHALAIKFRKNDCNSNIYISAGDGSGLNAQALEWSNVYAKVNIDPAMPPQVGMEKLFPIGPSFGIRYLQLKDTLFASMHAFISARRFVTRPRDHFANYYRQWRYRLPFDSYQPGQSQSKYLFFVATLWRKEKYVNDLRASIIKTGSSTGLCPFQVE